MSDNKASARALLAVLGILTDEELLALTNNPGELKQFCGDLVAEINKKTFVFPLPDRELQKQFPQLADRLSPWLKLAVAMDYRGPVAWKVKPGFTLKAHASLAGPCYRQLEYLKEWNFEDTPTTDSVVFWVPCLAELSTKKSLTMMEEHRAKLRQTYCLPDHHCDRFGSISLIFGLIMAHFKRTGERTLLSRLKVVSDTSRACGARLIAGQFYLSDGFSCDCWVDKVALTVLASFF